MSEQDLVWAEPQTEKQIFDELIDDHKITKFYPLYSGGQDSGCIVDYCYKNYPEYTENAVFTCTGIGSPMTRKFALEYAKERQWDIELTWARKSYYDIIMENGFPGAGSHRIIMGYLKFQSWYYYLKPKLKQGEKACFISGVRKKESWARDKIKFYSKKPIDVNATLTFCKPFLYKNGNQLQEYFITNGLKKSPAYDFFGKSGECWCGCFYNDWELKMLEKHDPFLFQSIKWLERQVADKINRLRYYEIPKLRKNPRKNRDVIKTLANQLYKLEKSPHWGRSVGADFSALQNTMDMFQVNEDYCGESCVVA